jgi:hypothetical protein
MSERFYGKKLAVQGDRAFIEVWEEKGSVPFVRVEVETGVAA